MAMRRVFCRSRLWQNSDFCAISKYLPLVNCYSLNKWVQINCQIQIVRQFRTNFSVNLVTKQKNEKDKDNDKEGATTSTSSSSSSESDDESDSDSEKVDVTVKYHRGRPTVTVPLPSRKEKCSFTLKPITNTVGDFLDMLRNEDKGIDRVVCKTMGGTRVASSNTIAALLDDDFRLIINDVSYNVRTPKAERLTSEQEQSLQDLKYLINKLYHDLHVDEHVQVKEKDLLVQLETIGQEVQPLEEKKMEIELVAQRKSNWLAWAGLGLMSVQFGILARLTWWEYSWDIMEPVTYFVTYGTAMATYAYFVLTKQEYILTDVRDRQQLLIMHKNAKKMGVDLQKYNQLKAEMQKAEYELKRLRKLHKLPAAAATAPPAATADAKPPTEATKTAQEKPTAKL